MSKSALIGLNVGAGLLVIGLQLPRFCGLDVASGSFFAQLVESSRQLSEANRASCAFGVGVLAILVLGERLLPGRPIPLVVLCSSLLLSRLAGLSGVGVTLLGFPPPGTESASLLAAAQAFWPRLLLLAVPVFLLAHVQDISAAREVDARRPEGLSPTHELLANGATNLTAGLLGGMLVAGAGLPSSLSKEEGARSTLALAVSGVLILLVVLFPAPLRFVPEAMLSANLIRHALLLIDIGALLRLYRGARREFTTAATTAVGVLLLGPMFGVLIGVVVTVCDASEHMNHRLAAALGSALGRTPRAVRHDGAGNHPACPPVDRVMISQLDASVLFLNAESLRRRLVEQLNQELERRPVDLLVLDLERSRVMDVSGAEMIHELQDVLARREIVVKIAGARTPIIRFLAAAEPDRFPTPGRSAAAVIHDWRRSTPDR
jgi:MFS superfamily sulfate permease-like transporter